MFLGGIDEAGRGSVFGPLVIAGISFDLQKINELEKMKIRDSKKITSTKREALYKEITKICESIFICKINCMTIDKFVKYNKLNILESKFMTVIADNLNAKKIIVDSCDVNPFRFQQEIKKNLNNKEISIYSFHKADSDNIIVSSASIIAKVTRDKEISKIKKTIGKDIGSGYPSDPKTKLFLNQKDNITQYQNYIRLSWKPVKEIINKNIQTTLFVEK
ncbi:MAG: ribonuclease HII [Candidatus Nitrosocosmicus sp.]